MGYYVRVQGLCAAGKNQMQAADKRVCALIFCTRTPDLPKHAGRAVFSSSKTQISTGVHEKRCFPLCSRTSNINHNILEL